MRAPQSARRPGGAMLAAETSDVTRVSTLPPVDHVATAAVCRVCVSRVATPAFRTDVT